MSPSPGEVFGHYLILDRLGSGGMGDVYRANDLRSGRDVAIKVLRQDIGVDSHRLHAFETEARAASVLNHPNIITVCDVGTTDSIRYIAMELVEGLTLRGLLMEGSLNLERVCSIGTQIASGLASAHDAGIVHRDLKPENLMLTKTGLVKILDFGLAKFTSRPENLSDPSTSSTTTTSLRGTIGYMSPEQVNGQSVDFRSDQFALGIVLYEMTAGRHPFQRPTTPQTLTAILESEPEPLRHWNPHAPRSLVLLIEKCLSKNPKLRFDSTHLLVRQLEEGSREGEGLNPFPEGRVIGVLPFEDFSEGVPKRFFSDGIAEELRIQLCQLPSIRLLSRYASSVPALSRVKPDAVIEGSVRFSGGHVRVTATMVDVRTEIAFWSAQYDHDLNDLLTVQTEVASSIVAELRPLLCCTNSPVRS